MAQDWFDQGTSGAAPPRQGMGGWYEDPYKQSSERRANASQGMEAQRLGIAQSSEARARENDAKQDGDRYISKTDDLARRFDSAQAVKEYRAVVPTFMAGLKAKDDPNGDNALIYNYAKVMDPGSVVQEAEKEGVAATAGFWEAKVAQYKKDFGYDSGGLPQDVRVRLRREMNTKMAEMAKAYGVQRKDFQTIAQQRGLDPFQVVGSPPMSGQQVSDYQNIMKRYGFQMRDEIPAIASGGPVEGGKVVDPTGRNQFSTDRDRQYAAVAQAAFDNGADRAQMDAIAKAYGAPAFGEDLDSAIEGRRRGLKTRLTIPASGQDDGDWRGEALATPLGTGVANYLNAASFGVPQLLTGDKPFDALRDENWKSALTGDVLGGVTGTLAGVAGLAKAGLSLPRAATGANLGYGTIFGANTSEGERGKGALIGGGGALVGEGVGRYALSPAVDAILRSSPGQKALGMFGKATPRNMEKPEIGLVNDLMPNIDGIRTNLADAERLGLPMSLADASPAARMTLGSAARHDPVTLETIGNQLSERGLSRNERALDALNKLAQPVDMKATSDEIFKAADEAASPFYSRAYDLPAVTTPTLEDLLGRPSMRNAMGKARTRFAEQGRSPETIGFGLDEAGDPILNQLPTGQMTELGAAQTALADAEAALARGNASLAGNVDRRGLQKAVDDARTRVTAAQGAVDAAPSAGTLAEAPAYNWEALAYTKRGLDDVLEGHRDPTTRRMSTEGIVGDIENTRRQFRQELRSLNDDYAKGDDAFSAIARRNDDLNLGYSAASPSMNMPDFTRAVSNTQPEGLDYFRRGYVTNLADQIGRNSDTTNAYNVVAGGMNRRAKLGQLFPNADDFLRQRELEGMMAATRNEVTGGSPTQPRKLADERFAGDDLGLAAEVGLSAVTGMPPVGAITRGAEKGIRGMFGRRGQQLSAERARTIAPVLADQNPASATSALDSLLSDMAALNAYRDRLKAGSAAVAAPVFSVAGSNYF